MATFPCLNFTRGSSHSAAQPSTSCGRLLATKRTHTDCPHLPFLLFSIAFTAAFTTMSCLYSLADTNHLSLGMATEALSARRGPVSVGSQA